MEEMYRTIVINPADNVAIALQDIPANTEVVVRLSSEQSTKITVKTDIIFGHKFATKLIQRGNMILKYGEVIGRALNNIEIGEHVHIHNLEGTRGRGDKVNENQ